MYQGMDENTANELMKPFWDEASERFAQQASGDVTLIANSNGIDETRTFMTIEYPALINNNNVDISSMNYEFLHY